MAVEEAMQGGHQLAGGGGPRGQIYVVARVSFLGDELRDFDTECLLYLLIMR